VTPSDDRRPAVAVAGAHAASAHYRNRRVHPAGAAPDRIIAARLGVRGGGRRRLERLHFARLYRTAASRESLVSSGLGQSRARLPIRRRTATRRRAHRLAVRRMARCSRAYVGLPSSSAHRAMRGRGALSLSGRPGPQPGAANVGARGRGARQRVWSRCCAWCAGARPACHRSAALALAIGTAARVHRDQPCRRPAGLRRGRARPGDRVLGVAFLARAVGDATGRAARPGSPGCCRSLTETCGRRRRALVGARAARRAVSGAPGCVLARQARDLGAGWSDRPGRPARRPPARPFTLASRLQWPALGLVGLAADMLTPVRPPLLRRAGRCPLAAAAALPEHEAGVPADQPREGRPFSRDGA